MARTKQTARKSAGVKPPRKQLSSSTFKPWTIIDHTGNKIAFSRKISHREFGFFPFQVYILATAASLATNIDFPDRLRDYIIANNGSIRFNENCDWRLEIFSVPQSSILDCIKHHEQEKRYRKSLGKGPIMLNRKELLVVDAVDWETKGLLSVEYTAQLLGRSGSEREFENHVNDRQSYQDGEEEELALPGLRQDLVVKRHPHVDQLAERFLEFVWYDEGHEWALSSLTDRNVALGWPEDPRLLELNTLPDKPVARQITRGYLHTEMRSRSDDECEYEGDEGDQFTNYLQWEDIITYGERCDPDTGVPKSIAHTMKSPPSATCTLVSTIMSNDVEAHEVIDRTGKKCVSCSHITHDSCNTKLSYTLYVIGQRAESPQTFFTHLNRKLLRSVPWMLHVYFVPDLASALSQNGDEMASRPVSGRLPTSYAGPPDRLQSHVCLYIDEHMAWEAGPNIITRDVATAGAELEVMHAGGWDNAAQMLFTWLVVCAETPKYAASTRVDINHG